MSRARPKAGRGRAGRAGRQRLGQHFLGDAGWRKRILETLPRHAGDVWVEIGAGHGEMTELLAAQGRRVIAIETDVRLATRLRERSAEWTAGAVEVVEADVLKTDLASLAGERFRVYGNLPYYITSPILHRVFESADQIDSIHVVVQFEVAARIVARPGRREYAYLSSFCQFYATPEIVLRVPPGAFRPPPRVMSALVRMALPGERTRLGVSDEGRFLEFLKICFGQKRKTIRNNLLAMAPDSRIQEALAASRLRGDARAEQMTLEEFAALFARL
jgi:16S rRNA (adenine1518-N6/adenine1519-N6)-dimethyltransferase